MSVLTEPAPAPVHVPRPRVAFADGIAFMARTDLVHRPSGLAATHPELVTVAVGVEGGRFVVEFDDGGIESCGGAELAAALPPVPLFGADIRMWFDWLHDRVDRAYLRQSLGQLAESTGATVWAPVPGGRTRIAPACRDLAVVDDDGEPSVWEAYQPGPATTPRYVCDPDGRLLPAGGLVLTGRPGVPLISAPHDLVSDRGDRYPAAGAGFGEFVIDLPVLEDGRLAVWCSDGTLFGLGPRLLVRLLETRGWRGENVLLLADLTAGQNAGLIRYLQEAGAALGRTLPIDAAGIVDATVAQPVDLDGGDGAGDLDVYEAMYGPDPTRTRDWTPAAVFLSRPNLAAAQRRHDRHGLSWLPDLPQVNDEEFDLYVRSEWTPDQAAIDGIPSPRPFLVGHLGAGPAGSSVQVRVPAHCAIDVVASGATPPAEYAALLVEADAYVLPARWLDECRIVLDDSEALVPAALCFTGAAHGVHGLPEDLRRWPSRGQTRAYAILPDGPSTVGDSLPLSVRRPEVKPGRLVELRIGAGLALEVAPNGRRLALPSSVRSILPELRSAGVDLLLPRAEADRILVSGLFTAAGRGWRAQELPGHTTLASLLSTPGR